MKRLLLVLLLVLVPSTAFAGDDGVAGGDGSCESPLTVRYLTQGSGRFQQAWPEGDVFCTQYYHYTYIVINLQRMRKSDYPGGVWRDVNTWEGWCISSRACYANGTPQPLDCAYWYRAEGVAKQLDRNDRWHNKVSGHTDALGRDGC